MSTKLHTAIIGDATLVRNTLAELNVPAFFLTIKVEGRVLSDEDECRITYTVGSGWEHEVKGDSTEACLTELARRLGWHQDHQPLALSAPRTPNRAKAQSGNWNGKVGIGSLLRSDSPPIRYESDY
jgi:hypothetical protein